MGALLFRVCWAIRTGEGPEESSPLQVGGLSPKFPRDAAPYSSPGRSCSHLYSKSLLQRALIFAFHLQKPLGDSQEEGFIFGILPSGIQGEKMWTHSLADFGHSHFITTIQHSCWILQIELNWRGLLVIVFVIQSWGNQTVVITSNDNGVTALLLRILK